jgi:SAM-dependent methyltransferase
VELLKERLESIFENEALITAVLSDMANKGLSTFVKLTIRPFTHKGEKVYQLEYDYEKKVLHKNVTASEAMARIVELIGPYFKQAVLFTVDADLQVLYHKKNGIKIIESKATKVQKETSHNRVKQYILKEGNPVDFLVALGITNGQGAVLKDKQHKFKQINKFLEFIEDAAKHLPKDRPLKILDFGCGKAYLTFALYYYFTEVLKRPVEVIGLDLKTEVIMQLNQLKDKLSYGNLRFLAGDIRQFIPEGSIDMMITLHACDTATDFAIEKAIDLNAQAILSVPCCQHEIFAQLKKDKNPLLYKHGIVKEKFAALLTDALRASALEAMGYDTEIVEFIDMEHTPKNMLIRAYKKAGPKKEALDRYREVCGQWAVEPMLGKLLHERFQKNI